jgi:hypothetical protein
MAHPIGFREANDILLRPKGMTSEECSDLEVFRNGEHCISRWQLSDADLEELKRNNGKVYLSFLGNTHPPVAICVETPFVYPEEGGEHENGQA